MRNGKAGVGVIGCGTISNVYIENLAHNYKNVEVIACFDLNMERAEDIKKKYGLEKACLLEDILEDPNIDIVVNLTIPSAHHEINMKALKAGKHVYCEKPLALTLEDINEAVNFANDKGLIIAAAPDTFLGAGIQTCRKIIDSGAIGTVVGATANLVGPGHEQWHPAAEFFYKHGAGPMLDMGPYYITALVSLLGPVKKVGCLCRNGRNIRNINGKDVNVEVPTHYAGIIDFECGAAVNINMSFEVWKSDLPCIEIYGTKGTLFVPDPNMFAGPVKLFTCDELVEKLKDSTTSREKVMLIKEFRSKDCEVPLAYPNAGPRVNMRGVGVSEMASAIINKRPCRLSGELSRHVQETLLAFEKSEHESNFCNITTTCVRPEPMPEGLQLWAVE